MSEPKVFPDRRGYWQAKTKYGNEIVLRVIGGEGFPQVYIDLRGRQQRPEDFDGEWLALVPSAEAVQAAVDAMESMCDCEWLATEDRKMLNNAISGLTGGEVR